MDFDDGADDTAFVSDTSTTGPAAGLDAPYAFAGNAAGAVRDRARMITRVLPFTVFDQQARGNNFKLEHDLPKWVRRPNGNGVLGFHGDYATPVPPAGVGAANNRANYATEVLWVGGVDRHSPAARLRNFKALVSEEAYRAFVGSGAVLPIRVHVVNLPDVVPIGLLSPTLRGHISTQAAFVRGSNDEEPMFVIHGVTTHPQTGLMAINIGTFI